MRSIEKLAEVIRRIAKKENVRIRNIDSSIIRSVGIFDDGSLLSNDTLRSYPSILSLSLLFEGTNWKLCGAEQNRERVNEKAGSIGEREKGGGGGGSKERATTGSVLLHEYPIMTDYRGINSLFNQQTTYPACRLSNKIWRPWPRAPNDSPSPSPFPLVFARSSTPFTIARSLHFARGHF